MVPQTPYQLQGAESALAALAVLNTQDRVTVASLAGELGISRSRCHRLLRTLESEGFAVLSDTGRGYHAGPALLAMTASAAHRAEARIRVRPLLDELSLTIEESVHSATLVGDHVLVVDGRRAPHGADIGLRTGMTAPAHAMAAGKLLLAALDNAQVLAFFPSESLVRRGPHTITSRHELLAELVRIRRRGWAESRDESEAGVHSIAIPLDGNSWRSRTALVLSIPASRTEEVRMHELVSAAQQSIDDFAASGNITPWRLP
ncbi:MAG: IclR family transcriptional regulator C-terminal domain-containing protein [Leucobacter sp.]